MNKLGAGQEPRVDIIQPVKKQYFAGLTCGDFMRQHWQKKPLLARKALPHHAGAVTREDLMDLAQRDDVESRIVRRTGRRWHVRHGPFNRRDLARMPASGWTLLVQGVDQVLPRAARLLRDFAFIPYARLDDMMVSYAAPGGGVGPHVDSYDVFLLQGEGRRRWRISRQRDLALVPGLPLKILRRFTPEREWLVEAGDLLYLPPLCAHEGTARGECITYSIGFRAASAQELGGRFLDFLHDRLELEGMYEDPDLKPTRTPGRIPDPMIARVSSLLEDLRWTREDVIEFVGRDLTEPKPNAVFQRPVPMLQPQTFATRIERAGVRLALRSRMLVHGVRIFLNGESHACRRECAKAMAVLADERHITPPLDASVQARHLLYGWYRAGYIELGTRTGE